MVARKRGREEMESSEPAKENTGLLARLRNMWQFANVMQYIFIFGKAVKIDDDFDIEDLEDECLKPGPSEKLAEIGLCMLKFISSHRGLTPDLFDEYTRRQYVAKAPSRNPYGTEDIPKRFADFDIFTKLRVLWQLSQWTLLRPDLLREKLPEAKDTDQTEWRMEELGYDRQERLYFVLDDNRLYRRTDPAPPPPSPKPKPKPKAKSKAGKAAARASKRRKTTDTEDITQDVEETPEGKAEVKEDDKAENAEDDGLGGRTWECIAVTLADYKAFLETMKGSRDPDEKVLYTRLTDGVLPVIEKLEENRQKKIARRHKQLLNMEKLATAKRSSRIASKQDREKEEQERLAAERKREADLIAARKDAERQKQMEEARESRMMTREQRLKDREYKRLLAEEELANLSEDSKKIGSGQARMSERHIKAEMEKAKKELEKLSQPDEWFFDCSVCGVHGQNLDDGSHSIACEKCNVWQHSKCLGFSQEEAEKDDFKFICADCKRRIEDALKPKIPPLKFKVGSSSSPPAHKTAASPMSPTISNRENAVDRVNAANQSRKRKIAEQANGQSGLPPMKKFKPYYAPNPMNGTAATHGQYSANPSAMHQSIMNGPTLSPQGQMAQGVNGYHQPPPGLTSPSHGVPHTNGLPRADMNSHLFQNPPPRYNGYGNGQMPPRTPQTNYNQSPYSQGSSNPYYNSLDRLQPASSHSMADLPPPLRNGPSMSPNGFGPPACSPTITKSAPRTNGLPPYQSAVTPNQSAYMSNGVLHPSSPIASSNAGISPVKHSPPRPTSSYSVSGTPVIPPAPHLQPSPQVQNLHAPTKAMSPEQASLTNGRTVQP